MPARMTTRKSDSLDTIQVHSITTVFEQTLNSIWKPQQSSNLSDLITMTANPSAGVQLLPLSAEETAQFSLDDEDILRNIESQQREVLLGNGFRASTTAPGFNSKNNAEAATQRFPSWRDKLPSNREASRLTDEIELDDADSGSDDLDLLPPFTSAGTNTTTKSAQRKLQKVFKCCSPHFVAPRCTIM